MESCVGRLFLFQLPNVKILLIFHPSIQFCCYISVHAEMSCVLESLEKTIQERLMGRISLLDLDKQYNLKLNITWYHFISYYLINKYSSKGGILNKYVYRYIEQSFQLQCQVSRGWMPVHKMAVTQHGLNRWQYSHVSYKGNRDKKYSANSNHASFIFKRDSTLTVQKKQASPCNKLPCLTLGMSLYRQGRCRSTQEHQYSEREAWGLT